MDKAFSSLLKKELEHAPNLDVLPLPHRKALLKRMEWLEQANPHQIRPKGDWWSIWLLLAGRGAGKTRTAAEDCWWTAWAEEGIRFLVSAPTAGDVRDVCFEGESGILNVIPPELIAPNGYKSSLGELNLINGSLIKGIPASEPGRFRGPQFHHGWLDELAAWEYLDESWDMIQFGLRLGTRPTLIATTTPKPKELIMNLLERDGEDVAYVTATTYDNIHNLAPTFQKQILQYEGTTQGRQEIYAEVLNPEEAGLMKRSWFKLYDANKPFPEFSYVIQSYDVATSDKTINDPTACVVLGVFRPSPDSGNRVMLIDCWSDHMLYPDLRAKVQEEAREVYGDPDQFGSGKKVDLILIEDKSSGVALIQDLKQTWLPIRSYNPGKADKATRLNIVAPMVERGLVYLPESLERRGQPRTWIDPFLRELCAFPEAKHDDFVDAFSQALRYLRDADIIKLDHFVDNSELYADDERPKRVNPYSQ